MQDNNGKHEKADKRRGGAKMSFYKELTADQKKEMTDIRDRTSWKKIKLQELDAYIKELNKKQVPHCRTCMVQEVDKVFKRLKEAKNEAITMGGRAEIPNIKQLAKVDFEQYAGLYDEKTDKGCMTFVSEKVIANKSRGANSVLTVEQVVFKDYKCRKGHGTSFEVTKK